MSANSIDHFTLSPSSTSDGSDYYILNTSSGEGTIHIHSVFPGLFVSELTFSCSTCPLGLPKDQDWAGWIAILTCSDGRCELTLPSGQTTIIKTGDCCVYNCTMLPSIYHFPLNHFAGTAILLRMDILRESGYSLLKESAFPANAWLLELEAGPATFSDEANIQRLICSMYDEKVFLDSFVAKLRLMELLHAIDNRGLTTESQTACHTQEQIDIARQTHELLTADPGKPYNLKQLAAQYNISLSTLNNYFRAVYGEYIPAFIRLCRLNLAANLLVTSVLPVYEIAAQVGYANPSKFGTAFRKVYGMTPNEYRIANCVPTIPAT